MPAKLSGALYCRPGVLYFRSAGWVLKNSAGLRMGIPSHVLRVSKSLSPEIMKSALADTAQLRNLSSSGSRQSTTCLLGAVKFNLSWRKSSHCWTSVGFFLLSLCKVASYSQSISGLAKTSILASAQASNMVSGWPPKNKTWRDYISIKYYAHAYELL